jgi:transcriptional regulator with XRE-family HTH domain
MTTIGERVKAAREKQGIHQAELARRLGCSVNALSMLEKNAITDPRASRIIGIAEVLQVSADYLLGLPHATQEHAQPSADGAGTPTAVQRPRVRTAARKA